MKVVSNREEMVFRKDFEGNARYTLGLSKKQQDGTYEKGYITVRFKQDVELSNQTKIFIKSAWLTFSKHEGKTYPYIFINDFSVVDTTPEKPKEENPFKDFGESIKEDGFQQIEITEDDLPF